MEIEKGKFTAEIPLPPHTSTCSIEIRSHVFFVPSKLKMSSDHRELSFKVSHVVPLTKDEAALFRIMGEEPAAVGHWLVKHRRIKQ
jgi:hypothetical protein